MRSALHPFLPNGLSGDPALWIDLLDEGRSVLFDLGDLRHLSPRKLLRVDRVVVTHTHMDHFIGFDRLLRQCLGRDRELVVSGPAGFLDNVRGKIQAYAWNLIEAYPVRIVAEEIAGDTVRSLAFAGGDRMRPESLPDRAFDGTLHAERGFTIHATPLDHGIPVLGLALRETEHLAVDRDRLTRLGLVPGPWLSELKQNVRRCRPASERVEARTADGPPRSLACGTLAADILRRTPGRRIAYVADIRYTAANRRRVVALAGDVDLLVCEAAFLHADAALADERRHLTARQAGELAREAGAKKLAPFHFSPRYAGREDELLHEAAVAFGGPVVRLPRGLDGGEIGRPETEAPVL